jgi:hypothetical protein
MKGAGFGAQGICIRVQGYRFLERVKALGFMVYGL